MCYTQKRSFTSVSVKVVDTYRATTQLNKYPLLFTSLFDIGNVSADQDGSRLYSYLPLYFASELFLYLTILTMVWQPKGLCHPILTKFNAKTSFIKNNQELKFPKRPISVWYKHGPTCLVLPKDLTVHMDVELNPGPLQKKPIYLLTCLPTVSGLVSYPGNKLLSTNNADTRQVGICGSYYSDVFHRFSYWPCSSPLSSTYRRCRAGRRVRERKARNIHRIESLVSYPRASRGSDNLHKGSISHNLCVITPVNTNNNVSSNVTSTNSSFHANSLVNPRSILNFADFNSRSVRNKIESIINHVVENDNGLCTVTETWLNDADFVSIAQLSVAGYSFKNFPRKWRYRDSVSRLSQSLISGWEEIQSFEFSEWTVKIHDRSMRYMIVCRPPYSSLHPVSTSVFSDELSQFLENVYWKRSVFRNTFRARPIYRVIP